MNKRKMGAGKRGQVTFEYLIIVGMILLLVLPFFDYSFYALGANSGAVGAAIEAVEVATSLDSVAELGEGSMNTVRVTNDMVISQDGLVTAKLPDGQEISIPSTVTLQSSSIQLKPGSVAIMNTDKGLIASNKPVIKDVKPQNLKGVSSADVTGEYFTDDAVALIKGTMPNGVEFSRQITAQLETGTTTHLVLDINPLNPIPDGKHTLYIVQQGSVYSNGFPVAVGA